MQHNTNYICYYLIIIKLMAKFKTKCKKKEINGKLNGKKATLILSIHKIN